MHALLGKRAAFTAPAFIRAGPRPVCWPLFCRGRKCWASLERLAVTDSKMLADDRKRCNQFVGNYRHSSTGNHREMSQS